MVKLEKWQASSSSPPLGWACPHTSTHVHTQPAKQPSSAWAIHLPFTSHYHGSLIRVLTSLVLLYRRVRTTKIQGPSLSARLSFNTARLGSNWEAASHDDDNNNTHTHTVVSGQPAVHAHAYAPPLAAVRSTPCCDGIKSHTCRAASVF